eukprot:TRINITY_DN20858_c0_g1_i1.p1 TRINITY_DN20858_c0_g1~~TRINITY_DN20858_c0_g1_i1.p1  ORF type:complete len:333 (+),score=112.17 TRINITY_DN20858_c0_g1_i1:43-1041(+)
MDSVKYKRKWLDIELDTLREALAEIEGKRRGVSHDAWSAGIEEGLVLIAGFKQLVKDSHTDAYDVDAVTLQGQWEQHQLDLVRKSTTDALTSARGELAQLLREEAEKEAAAKEAAEAALRAAAPVDEMPPPVDGNVILRGAPWAAGALHSEDMEGSPTGSPRSCVIDGTHYTDGASDDDTRRSVTTVMLDSEGDPSRPASAAVTFAAPTADAGHHRRPKTAAASAHHDEKLLRSLHLELAKADDEIRELKKELKDTRGAQAKFIADQVRIGVGEYLESDAFKERMQASFAEGRAFERAQMQKEYDAWRARCEVAERSYMEIYKGRTAAAPVG